MSLQTETLEISGLLSGTRRVLAHLGRSNGQTAEEYVQMVLEAKFLAQQPFREILAPLRQDFAESGMTDAELDALVEQAREDFHRERPQEDK